jgi:hypothetical protein
MPTLPPTRLSSRPSARGGAAASIFVQGNASRFGLTPDFASFFAGLSEVETERIDRLFHCIRALERDARDDLELESELLVRAMPDEDDEHGALAFRTFAESVLGRVRGTTDGGGNLYLEARPPGAQLRAFELLRLRTPLIPFAYAAANRALVDVLERPGKVTIVDLGIGRGGQLCALIRHPAARRLITALHVVGIEPDSMAGTGAGALEIAHQGIVEAAQSVGLPATFHPISKRAELLEREDLERAGLRGRVLVNAAFSLHHVAPNGQGLDRTGVLGLLSRIGAEAVVLVEPDSNHDVDDLAVRFLYAYRHYRSVAHSLRQQLPEADAALVWSQFFAPEVRNVIGFDGRLRTERHEESARWREHLAAAGWTPETNLPDLVPQAAAPAGFRVRNRGYGLSLSFNDVDLLTVLRARP